MTSIFFSRNHHVYVWYVYVGFWMGIVRSGAQSAKSHITGPPSDLRPLQSSWPLLFRM